MQPYDVIILGAGASGLMCGKTAAERGRRTLILEHAEKPGRKLSTTGGGKCNLTNREVRPEDYAGENPQFCRSALARLRPQDLLDWLAAAKVPVEEREHGQMFCARSAKDLLNLLLDDCKRSGCRIATGEKVLAVKAAAPPDNAPQEGPADEQAEQASLPPRFVVRTTARSYAAYSVVVATGGPAWPQVGATGSGYEFARAFGHRILPIRPALAGLTLPASSPLAGLAGIAVIASIHRSLAPPAEENGPETAGERTEQPSRKRSGKTASSKPGTLLAESLPLLFTHSGISGPAALQSSLYWKKGDSLRVDFLPGLSFAALLAAPENGRLLPRNLLKKHLPARLCDVLVPEDMAGIRAAELARAQRDFLHDLAHAFPLTPSGTEGFAKAEVTAGGVSTEEISSRTMESRRMPGLFFCGEVLDVTGRLGGYNLHWAFASGKAAGEFV